MKTIVLTLPTLLFSTFVANAQSPSADEIMTKAEATASTEHKALFVHFDASWCAYCKRLDALLESPNVKPIFQTYFVTVKLVLMETEKKKHSRILAPVNGSYGWAALTRSHFMPSRTPGEIGRA